MRKLLIGTFLLLGGLTACSNTPSTTSQIWPLYRPQDFARAGGGRDTYVVLRGDPLSIAPAQFEQTVLSNMQGRNWGPRTNFTTHPTNYDNSYKVVMLFNGPNVEGGQLCTNPGAIPVNTGPQAKLHVMAVYCRYDQMMTLVQGYLPAEGPGVSKEGFDRLIQVVTADLFPPFNPDDPRRDHDGHDSGGTDGIP